LLFEDDAEWDVMIRQQMIEFARGTHYLQGVQSTRGLFSPYGDDWDMLWIGHCGQRSRSGGHRYWVIHDDPTVAPEHVRTINRTTSNNVPDDSADELQGKFTRIVYQPNGGRCLYAYAVSQRGARKFLYDFSIKRETDTSDKAASAFCGSPGRATCYTTYPSFVHNYMGVGDSGGDSDRRGVRHGAWRYKGINKDIVFGLKTNLNIWLDGKTQWPSHWPNDTLLETIDPETFAYPRGTGIYLEQDRFKGPPQIQG
jgi:hypothetical protein